MKLTAKAVQFEEIKGLVKINLAEQNSHVDSYLESHILNSIFYVVEVDGTEAGYFAVRDGQNLTHFYIKKIYRRYGQEIFEMALRTDHVLSAYVATGDELFVALALDRSKDVQLQAHFFETALEIQVRDVLKDFHLRQATMEDQEYIKEKSVDFFDDIPRQLENKELYIGILNNTVVSFGIIEKSKLYENVASTGMFVLDEYRISGMGRSTIMKLMDICKTEGITPIAGCWYYNHNSKKTLESAGYYSQSRLLNIKF